MIVVPALGGRRVGVFGLARSGLAAVRALTAGGAEVLAWDDNPKARQAAGPEIPLYDLAGVDWRTIPILVLSPGIPHTFPAPHPIVAAARAAGAEIIGDIELLARTQRAARYIGITGTNGKSTTTALTGHILREAGKTVEVGGNLGTAALSLAPLGGDGRDSARRAGGDVAFQRMQRVERLEALTFDEALATQVICGTPDSFTARLKEVQEEIGLDGILAELNCGGKIPHENVRTALRLLCQEVMPRFH